jgi:aspartate racemase
MAEEAKRLERAGATLLAIPCNTAHYFYDSICSAVRVPVINIIEETALYCKHKGVRRVGVLATEGTAASGAYGRIFEPYGIEIEPMTEDEQAVITHIIFDCIKSGRPYDVDRFMRVAHALVGRGCELLILGCTELSLIKKSSALPDYFADSLELLALAAIRRCGREPIGFDCSLTEYYLSTNDKKEV